MTEMDFGSLMKAATNPQVAQNAFSIGDTLKQLNGSIDQLEGVFKLIDRVEQSPGLSTLLRIAAKKEGVEIKALKEFTVSKPADIVYVGIQPTSETHKVMYEELQKMSEEQLKALIAQQKRE